MISECLDKAVLYLMLLACPEIYQVLINAPWNTSMVQHMS